MSRIAKNEIIQACLDGIKTSFDEYEAWSGGEWLWNAPEYLLTVNIAKKLWEIDKSAKFITLEDNVRETLKSADAKIKGKISSKARPSGRSDIIFWWGKGSPRGVIEVKNAIYNKNHIQEDLDRIYELLKKDSSLEFGITTFYIDRHFESPNATEKLEKRIQEEFIENIEEEADTKGYRVLSDYLCIQDMENDATYAVAIMIYK